MKRTERHRLKENEVMLSVTRAREAFEQHRRPITIAGVAILAVVLVVAGYFMWRGRTDAQSRVMLADAMDVMRAQVVPPTPPAPPAPDGQTSPEAPAPPGTPAATPASATPPSTPAPPPAPPPGSYPSERAKLEAALPKFKAAADDYPSTPAGIAARYYEAATLLSLGRPAEAIQQYQRVIDGNADSLYGTMARLGKADAEAAAKQYDAAIASYQQLATMKDSSVPIDGVLMQLGRTYEAAGKTADALRTFQRIVDEYPQSVYASDAKKALDTAKAAGAAGAD